MGRFVFKEMLTDRLSLTSWFSKKTILFNTDVSKRYVDNALDDVQVLARLKSTIFNGAYNRGVWGSATPLNFFVKLTSPLTYYC